MNLFKNFFLILISVLVIPGLIFFQGRTVTAQNNEEKILELHDKIETYEREVKRLQLEANTLKNQIAQFDAQISLTGLKIEETIEKIEQLGGRIDELEVSLQALTKAFSSRVQETYKLTRVNSGFLYLLSAPDMPSVVTRFHYLQKAQEADQDLMMRLTTVQTNYKGEKKDQEELQEELTVQRQNLASQKNAKAYLLEVTKNDEKKYQNLLSAARAEFEAIQAILAGKGTEEEVGKVGEGEKIASIIQGSSCNSSGSHLHFMMREGTTALNPFAHLSANVSYENCSGSSCGSGDGDSFNPGGSWNWPIDSPIKFTQGYGSTWAIKNSWVGRIYSFHNGIDINSGNSAVKAVKSGTLYRGSYGGSSGCRLRYVRVDHDDSNVDTLYLHVNY